MTCASLCLAISAWLSVHGYDDIHREARLRQMWTESRFTPCVIARSGSEGLDQLVGVRRRRLHAAYGPGCVPWQRQLEFTDRELRTEPAYRAFWEQRTADTAFAALRTTFGFGRRYLTNN